MSSLPCENLPLCIKSLHVPGPACSSLTAINKNILTLECAYHGYLLETKMRMLMQACARTCTGLP